MVMAGSPEKVFKHLCHDVKTAKEGRQEKFMTGSVTFGEEAEPEAPG
jgi:hypothetical protein